MLLTLAVFTWTLPASLWHNHQRYIYPIVLPWLALGIVRAVSLSMRRSWARVTAVVLLIVPLLFRPYASAPSQESVDAAQAVERLVPRGTTVLVHDAGAVAFYTSHRVVDLVGLKTPSSVLYHRALTWPSAGRARGDAIAAIAESSGAGAVIVADDWDVMFSITAALRKRGWTLTPLRQGRSRYSLYLMHRGAGDK
jgi:hypothetical protein